MKLRNLSLSQNSLVLIKKKKACSGSYIILKIRGSWVQSWIRLLCVHLGIVLDFYLLTSFSIKGVPSYWQQKILWAYSPYRFETFICFPGNRDGSGMYMSGSNDDVQCPEHFVKEGGCIKIHIISIKHTFFPKGMWETLSNTARWLLNSRWGAMVFLPGQKYLQL